jgi:predicted ester cyclase
MRDLTAEKQRVHAHMSVLAAGGDPARVFAPDAVAEVAHPWGRCEGPAAIGAVFETFRAAMPDMIWRAEMLIAGENHTDPRLAAPRFSPLVGMWGHMQGTFARPCLSIPPTHGAVHLRLAMVHHLNDAGLIARSWIWPDLPDLMDQAGVWPLPPMLGARGTWLGPRGAHGVRLDATDAAGGAESLARVLEMHDALHAFDGVTIESMPMHHWADAFMYYAAAGIGTCRGLDGFRAHHQIPFLRAFPDRRGAGHFVRIGDGNYALTGGNVAVTHRGEYLGMAPTGRAMTVRVMDFYHFDADGRIIENWLPFDILGLAHEMGVDLLARVAHLAGQPRRHL